jgi:putative ABC transport system ATP-binding protein
MIHLDNVHFRYPSGEFRLEVPQLSAAAGEKVAVIGPSGSGKTTLLNLVAGILAPAAGRLEVDGTALTQLGERQRRDFRAARIGFIFQDFGLIDYLDVLDNIVHPCRISSALKLTSEIKQKARQLARQLGVSSRTNHHPAKLSHGEQQRVAICRALLLGPKLILADEATGNLDPRNKALILDALFQAVATQQATVLAVTHDHELLDRFDRVIDFRDFLAVSPEAA